MDLTLVRPPYLISDNAISAVSNIIPIGVVELATYIKNRGHSVTVLDAMENNELNPHRIKGHKLFGQTLEEIINSISKDSRIIGISCLFSKDWIIYKELAEKIKKKFPDSLVVLGGEHATADYKYILKNCPSVDYCILGEGEVALDSLLEYLKGNLTKEQMSGISFVDKITNKIIKYETKRITQQENLIWPDWDFINIQKYIDLGAGQEVWGRKTMPILGSRGCPYTCTFCTNEFMWGRRMVYRDPSEIVDKIIEYKKIYKIDHIEFFDWAGIINKNWIFEICTHLIDRNVGITFSFPVGTRAEVINPDIIHLMIRAGLVNILFAPESGSPTMVKTIRKQINLESLLKKIEACNDQGIRSGANFIIGFPNETNKEIFETIRYIFKCLWAGLDDLLLYMFTPYPGSTLHEELVSKNIIIKEGEDYENFLLLNNYNDFIPNSHIPRFRRLSLYVLVRFIVIVYYGLSLLMRPKRYWNSFRNIWKKKPCGFVEVFIAKKVYGNN